MRDQPERRPAGPLRHERHAGREQGGVAAELVDHEPHHRGGVGGVQHRMGADHLGDHAAPVDVAEQHHGHGSGARKPHVGDVARPQVDLGGAAGALDQHEVGLGTQALEAFADGAHEARLPVLILARSGVADHPALHHNLRSRLALRLEQHGVHVDAWRHARGARLQGLGAADLAAVSRHGRVVGHVLRLEGPHREAAVGERAGEARDDQALAHVRARALHHEGARAHQNSMPAWAFTPAAKWCFGLPISVTRSATAISSGLALRPVTTTWRSGRRAASRSTTASVAR